MTDTNQEVRETWVTVPREPTEVALQAGLEAYLTPNVKDTSIQGTCRRIYAAMLASAPPPAVPDAVGVRELAKVLAASVQEMDFRLVADDRYSISLANANRIVDQARHLAAALSSIKPTPPPEPQASNAGAADLYLIRKGAFFYRPNSQGYTASVDKAGRYSLEEAEQITHPNGPEGPRDGMDYIPAPAALTTPEPQTGERDGNNG